MSASSDILQKIASYKGTLPVGVTAALKVRGTEFVCEVRYVSPDLIPHEVTGELIPRVQFSATYTDIDKAIADITTSIALSK